jgi:hypothetical protein
MSLAALITLAIVTQDQAVLRAAPRDSAQQQAALWQGDALEIRGERMDYLQVYDHRRERAGYVRASQVRTIGLDADAAPSLLAVLRFVRDTPGAEALGIAYGAAYLKAAPASAIDAEPFDAIGSMADRLASRASARQGHASDPVLAAHLEVAASYGVTLTSFEHDGHIQLCYDGEAFQHVLALPANAEQRARAALSLTRHECVDPDLSLSPVRREALDQWRSEVLDQVDVGDLSDLTRNRVQLRRAGVWAALAFERSRRGEAAADAANRALQALADINPQALTDADKAAYTEAAVRVGASRWAASAAAAPARGLSIAMESGQPGETCVLLVDSKHDAKDPLLKRCTFGTVWPASAAANAQGTALALAVQPLATWREIWVFEHGANGWAVQVLPPASSDPDLGYSEWAGWTPDGKRMLAAREARVNGRWLRRFEVIRLDTLTTERFASDPSFLSLFYRWQSPAWKSETISLRSGT